MHSISTMHLINTASNADVLVILIGIFGPEQPQEQLLIIMDCGAGHNRRYSSATEIAYSSLMTLNLTFQKQSLPTMHSLDVILQVNRSSNSFKITL